MIALSRSSSVRPRFLATLALIGLLGCGGSTETSPPPPPPAPPTVTGVTPVLGHGGDAGLQVTVYGTNFSSTTTVAWERNGAAEAKVQVASVQVTNSGTLVAALNIAADAPVSFYDISATNASGKGAPLVERFEVTEGYPIEGTYYAYGVNEAGTVVGQLRGSSHVGFVWTRSASRAELPTEPGNIDTNGGRAIDEAGATIAGVSGNNAVVCERERVREFFVQQPDVTCFRSDANFLLVEMAAGAAAELHRGLAERGLVVKRFDEPAFQHCLRISLGTEAENSALLSACAELLPLVAAPAES